MLPDSSNPLAADASVAARSSYLGNGQDGLSFVLDARRAPAPDALQAHAALTGKVMDAAFPCVAARSAFNRGGYRFGLYDALGAPESAAAVCHDLYEFSREFPEVDDRFVTFVAAFRAPAIDDEAHFERLLWRQLQHMHDLDARHFAWNEAVSSDPDSPHFSFSIGGRAFFVVGLNAKASRLARRSDWTLVAFNFHEQFERLRTRGKYESMQRAIRTRDLAQQGALNPMLDDFGSRSETRQYSGRAVPDDWRCPFRAAVHERRAGQRRAQPRGTLPEGVVERRAQQRRQEAR